MNMFVVEPDPIFRVITLGNYAVGKTSIIRQFITHEFEDKLLPTIGIDFSNKNITIDNGVEMKIKIYDTSGQEKYHSLVKGYYKNADGILFVFSVNDEKSLESIEKWLKSFEDNCEHGRKIPKVLVGNKIDLEREITEEKLKYYSEKYELKVFYVSAKSGEGIEELFQHIGKEIYDEYKKDKDKNNIQQNIQIAEGKKKKKSKCCLNSLKDV